MKTTRPRSPDTLRCLFAISSLYGMTTVHPWRAVGRYEHSHEQRRRTESADLVDSRYNAPIGPWPRKPSRYGLEPVSCDPGVGTEAASYLRART